MTQLLEPSTDEESPAPESAESAEGASAPEAAAEEPAVVRVPGAARSRRDLLMLAGIPAATLVAGGAAGYLGGRMAGTKPLYEADSHLKFTYDNSPTGPDNWGELGHGNTACARGNEQSPIDITPRRLQGVDWLEPIVVKYKPITKAKVIHTGYTFQVNYDIGSRLTFMGREFELVQFHFHTPSEHLVNGRAADMEMHLVHATPDASRTLAVLGVLITAGAENPLLARFWERMPEKESKEITTPVTLDATEALPANREYWTYSGSLTTPPCSENVTWILLKNPIQASTRQIARFAEVFGKNARPVQPLKERFILEKAAPVT